MCFILSNFTYAYPGKLPSSAISKMNIHIRTETPADYPAVDHILKDAFGKDEEAILVENLRKHPDFIPALSLVAELDGQMLGHILFSVITIEGVKHKPRSLALAPVAVLPQWQNKGIGRQLIEAGLATARQLGFNSVVVLGHELYYPKFGFKPASLWRIVAPFPVPENNFMAMPLHPDGLDGVSGVVKYPEPFVI